MAQVDPTDDPPTPPLPVDPEDPNKDIWQGQKSFPSLDGMDIWPILTGVEEAAPRSLWLSREVLIQGNYKLVVAQPDPSLMAASFVEVTRLPIHYKSYRLNRSFRALTYAS